MEYPETKSSTTTGSGIPAKDVYTPEDTKGLVYDKDVGLPGKEPYTRGIYPNMYRGKLWTIRQFSGFGTPEETNQRFKHEYDLGQMGFSIAFDSVTESGIDSDDPRARADVGAGGVPVNSLEDMETLFEDLPIDKVNTAVVASPWTSCPLTAMYFVMAEKRGIPISQLDGTTQNDLVLFTSCCNLIDIIPPHHMIRLCVDLVEWCAQHVPKWHPVSFASYNYRENAITAYQEIGIVFALAIAFIEEELQRNRLDIDDFAPVLSFHLAAHNDFLEEIAKFRAARRMWYRIMKERYNARNPRSLMFRFHVQTSGSTHTYQQPLNNIVRVAYQILAAALGGAQSIHANSFDEAICLPTDQSILTSIRTQQIAQYEANVGCTADPLGGSYYLEWLTSELESQAWEYLARIEELGGVVSALKSGWLHREFAKAMREYETMVATGETKIVGVNCFQLDEEPYQMPVFRPNPQSGEIQKAKLERLRKERDGRRVEQALAELGRATEAGENVMPAVIEAVRAYATLGEICNVWRRVFPLWKVPIVV
ncbi:MAG: methylmalonyl-CoA mutase [Dehalococcoidia bacterium]